MESWNTITTDTKYWFENEIVFSNMCTCEKINPYVDYFNNFQWINSIFET